ncbi:MAG: hypothetical protein CMG50_05740 [Candidatus Marinimicrobia bacterium]|nr:hypothetical protein [Candidatus Neomarinimicrobiota bacterium]
MFKIKNKYLLFLLCFNAVLGSGVLSDLDNFSLYSSYSLFSYKEDFISESLELVNTRPHYSNISIGLIYNGKYELRFNHINNSSPNNIYSLPFKDEFISVNINYHIKKLDYIDFKIGLSTMEAINNQYSSSAFLFGSYKDINYFNNPVVIYFDYKNSTHSCLTCDLVETSNFSFGGKVKLYVDKLDNNELKDILFLGLTLNTNDFNRYYFGVNSGLFIPIK